MAQRMEAVAPPGAVLLSESTAQLVDHLVALAEPEWVHIKGADEPVRARVGSWRSARAMGRSGGPKRAWSVGAGRWRPSTP
jgi:class 3 adenylate cyclase